MSAIHEASVSVVAVRIEYAGAQLVGDHVSGVSALVVDDAFEFNEGAGSLLIDGDTLAYTGWDDDTNTITLSAPTSAAYDADTEVRLVPSTPIKVADVVDITGASFPALVWHTLDPLLREGIRAPEDQETGTIFYSGDHEKVWLVNCPGKVASIDPAALPSTGGDIDPEIETVYLDGPPDFYAAVTGSSSGGDDSEPLVDYATMLAATSAPWAALVSSAEFVDGTLTVSRTAANQMDGSTFPSTPYFPVWSVPTDGRTARVVMASLTVDRPTPGSEDAATLGYQMADGATTMTALVDDFQRLYQSSSPFITMTRDRFVGYQSDHGGGFFQTPPYLSFTEAESVADGYFVGATGSHVAVVVAYPFISFYSGSGGLSPEPDASWVFASVGVELE